MPSYLHEMLVELVADRPELAVELITDLFGITLPVHSTVAVEPAELSELAPAQYQADMVVVLRARGKPVWAVVVEAQLHRNPEKVWSWPVYVALVRARSRCPVTLLVICPDAGVARWCARPVELGLSGTGLGQLVLGPDRVPVITDAVRAGEVPELAVLSAVAHGGERAEVLDALWGAFAALDPGKAQLYCDIVLGALPLAAREHLEALMKTGTYEYQSDFARGYFFQGKAEGKAEGVLTFLAARGIDVPDGMREQIIACTDHELLDRWARRAATASTVEDLFTEGE